MLIFLTYGKGLNLNLVVDRSFISYNYMIYKGFLSHLRLTFWVSSLQGGLHGFDGAWQRWNALKWNDHFALLRLATHAKNRTLLAVQLPDLG